MRKIVWESRKCQIEELKLKWQILSPRVEARTWWGSRKVLDRKEVAEEEEDSTKCKGLLGGRCWWTMTMNKVLFTDRETSTSQSKTSRRSSPRLSIVRRTTSTKHRMTHLDWLSLIDTGATTQGTSLLARVHSFHKLLSTAVRMNVPAFSCCARLICRWAFQARTSSGLMIKEVFWLKPPVHF